MKLNTLKVYLSFFVIVSLLLCNSLVLASTENVPASQLQAELVAEISALLDKGTFTYTPIALKYHANHMSVDVEVIEYPGENYFVWSQHLRKVIEQELEALAENWQRTYPDFSLWFPGEDIHITHLSGFERKCVKDSFLSAIAEGVDKDALTKLLNSEKFKATYFWFQIYDLGAGLIMDEIFVIDPIFSNKGLIIRLSYMHR